jgi:hypothetical protein
VGAWAGVPSVRCPCQQVQQPKATLTENGKKMLARAQKINLTKEHTGVTAFQSEVRPALLHHGILALHTASGADGRPDTAVQELRRHLPRGARRGRRGRRARQHGQGPSK